VLPRGESGAFDATTSQRHAAEACGFRFTAESGRGNPESRSVTAKRGADITPILGKC
jgi:hypothetical protein